MKFSAIGHFFKVAAQQVADQAWDAADAYTIRRALDRRGVGLGDVCVIRSGYRRLWIDKIFDPEEQFSDVDDYYEVLVLQTDVQLKNSSGLLPHYVEEDAVLCGNPFLEYVLDYGPGIKALGFVEFEGLIGEISDRSVVYINPKKAEIINRQFYLGLKPVSLIIIPTRMDRERGHMGPQAIFVHKALQDVEQALGKKAIDKKNHPYGTTKDEMLNWGVTVQPCDFEFMSPAA